jgi:small subunit ribosomal protein S6
MLKHYETVFISTPVLSDSQVKEAVQKYCDIITENGGEIVHEEIWGLKKLAYPIQKKTTGFYSLIEFKAPPPSIEKLDIQYRRDERVIRHLIFSMDRHAVEYAEKRRNSKNEKKGE